MESKARVGWVMRRHRGGIPLPVGAWPGLVLRMLRRAAADRLTTAAASLSFHWFLAVFPAIIALLGIAGLVGLSHHDLGSLVHGVSVVLPASAAQVVVQALESPPGHSASLTAVAAGTAVALWGGIEAMAALQIGLDLATESRTSRSFLSRRLVAMPLLGATAVAGGGSFALLVLGEPVGTLLRHSVPFAGTEFAIVWDLARVVGAIVLVSLLLGVYYSVGPSQRRSRRAFASPGSLVAAVGWLGTSEAYSFYLDHLGHESRTYGAFAGVVVLLLWLYITGFAVLLGAAMDRELDREREAQGQLPGNAGVGSTTRQRDEIGELEQGR